MLIHPSKQDLEAIRELELDTGETLSDCYQCGKCTAGCPASMDTVWRIVRHGFCVLYGLFNII